MGKYRRLSVQREKIYELIRDSRNHPTALWVYERLKNEFSSLSLGNVYRNIRILIEDNRIRSRVFRDSVEHFDAVLSRHDHFICEICSEISDVRISPDDKLAETVQNQTNHSVKCHIIQFYGICNKCKDRYKEVTS